MAEAEQTGLSAADSVKARIPNRKPGRSKPTPAGKAGRMVAAGGAVGVSLALVGAMSAAAGHAASTKSSEANQAETATNGVRRVVVLPDPAQQNPQQIVIVLPESITGPAQPGQGSQLGQINQPATQVVVTAPPRPAAPAPAPKPVAPVTESSGS